MTPVAATLRSSSPSRRVSPGSRPAAGSSSASTAGAMASARAISTRRLSTCGERAGQAIEGAGVADEGEQALGAAPPRSASRSGVSSSLQREAAAAQRDQHVVDHAHVREQLRRLVGAGDAGARDLVRGEAGDLAPGEADRRRDPAR